jgi:Tol biopolymer transport system component
MDMRRIILAFGFFLLLSGSIFAQFGQNKVNYKMHEWYFIQTKHFDIYYYKGSETVAEYAAHSAEEALAAINSEFNYQLGNRISLLVYASHNDFQETNTTDEYLSKGIGGFTEPFKNRVVVPFEGNYAKFEHVIHHELVHAVLQDMLYGGSIQNIISRNINLQIPLWFQEGIAEYLSAGWDLNEDQFIRNAILSATLPNLQQLSNYYAYRGGQAVLKYIAFKYGQEKIGQIVNKIQSTGNFEQGFKAAIGIDFEELNERWLKDLKKEYWPDIANYTDPDEFAKRLTNNKKDGYGFYNVSPAISPRGDKIAFLSDKDIYLDLYLMNTVDGKITKKVLSSGKTTDLEELNVLFPSLCWAPDNKRVALSLKRAGYNSIAIINTENSDIDFLPVNMDGIESVSWSFDGKKIAFVGQNTKQSDIYVYDFDTNTTTNVINDIFSDTDPSWSRDNKKIFFSSDRGDLLKQTKEDYEMYKHDVKQNDLYMIDLDTKEITRITKWKHSNEQFAIPSPDGKEILFSSDYNGIGNIYKKRIVLLPSDSIKTIADLPAEPITNSLTEISQMSISADAKKLAFTSLYKDGYNIFVLDNPFSTKIDKKELKQTVYVSKLLNPKKNIPVVQAAKALKDSVVITVKPVPVTADTTKGKTDKKIFVGQIKSKESKKDTIKADYSKYVFGEGSNRIDSTSSKKKESLFKPTLDTNGNYLVNKYRINFSPDLVYASADFSTLYGAYGSTVLSFSDMLGNHRLIGMTNLQADLKNSDYGIAYYYLENKLDIGVQLMHTARFFYASDGYSSNLYRYRNLSFSLLGSYPLNRYYRLDLGLSLLNVSSENLDDLTVPSQSAFFITPSIAFVHDNILFGYYSPIEGTRYSLTLFGNPGFNDPARSFGSVLADYRTYLRFFFDNSFVIRLSGGYSAGINPQRFLLGGTDNWLNREFATSDIPINTVDEFAFLSLATPMRGFNLAEKMGSKYMLLNLELRSPIIRYLVTGPLPILFQNILGTLFLDAGTAWNKNSDLKLFGKNDSGNLVTKDLLLGTGFGLRFNFIFVWRFDVAWSYDMQTFSKPKYYWSIGLDF